MRRGTLEHEIFAPVGKWSKYEAWAWMIESAAFKETVIDIGGKPYRVSRGSLCFSQRFLATKFNWSKKAVSSFLSQLEAHGAISLSVAKTGTGTRSKRTQITLCNYDKYQGVGAKREPKGGQKGAKEEQGNNIPVGEADKSTPPDPDKIMFESGRRLLAESGISSAKAGQLLGKWRKQSGTAQVIEALSRAKREGAIEPVAFIEGCLKYQAKQKATDRDGYVSSGAFGNIRERC